jgi:hypothetical protein
MIVQQDTRMKSIRWTEFLAFLITAVLIALAARTKRQTHSEIAALRTVQDSLRRLNVMILHDRDYLFRWARVSRPRTEIVLEGTTLDDRPMSLDFAANSAPLILYSINPDCSACFENAAYLSDIATRKPCGVAVVGVLVANGARFADAQRPDVHFPVLKNASGNAWDVLPLASSPTTVLLGDHGQLEGWWPGVLSPTDKASIETQLIKSCTT